MSERVNFAERVRFANEIGRLEEENAKLRELVKALNWCIDNGSNELGCDGCPLPQSSRRECECEIRMRELGVCG